jgi:twitching motility protein PilT
MDLNSFLMSLVSLGKGQVSDLHFKVGSPPLLRIRGGLEQARFNKLRPEDTKKIAQALAPHVDIESLMGLDTSYTIPDKARYRVNIFRQRGNISVVLRVIPKEIPTVSELHLPKILETIAMEERGLILVTGITGSGKSSTLAAMVDHINRNKKGHILTIEDPIEFIHPDLQCSVNQREVGSDTASFAEALREALREDPDVIMVGEMRDQETISIAIKAAETGHLVLSTLHTVDTPNTINRIVDAFPAEQQRQIRLQLAASLKAVIAQRLLSTTDDKRVPTVEIMRSTKTIEEYIEIPEKTAMIKDVIAKGQSQYGMQTFDQHLRELYEAGTITMETAVAAATSPADFERALTFE